jgi:TonB family protein
MKIKLVFYMKKIVGFLILNFVFCVLCLAQEKTRDENIDDILIPTDIYIYVDVMPQFPGGDAAMLKYLRSNIRYQAQALDSNIKEKVVVEFVVDTDGSLINVKVINNGGYGLSEEAIRVVRSMPKWIPGKQNGKKVRVSYKLPIKFTLKKESPPESSVKEEQQIIAADTSNKKTNSTYTESFPEFPAGDLALMAFLKDSLRFPAEAIKNKVEGIVKVTFVINKNGEIIAPAIKQGLGYGCDEEAMRLIKSMPNWKPAMQNGKPVRIQYTIPVKFSYEYYKMKNPKRKKK